MTHDDFSAFFEELHKRKPFPWQSSLAKYVIEKKEWPPLLDLPTGSGKTAAIDVAIFALALEADRPKGQVRRAAIRTFFVVDRRIVVDEAARRARGIARKLGAALHDAKPGSILHDVARRLVRLAGRYPDAPPSDDVSPLRVAVLRGGMYRDDTWADSPAQPLVCASTVNQVGSRLLFRGYGLGRSGRVVHAGLVGNDSLILLDEAHIAGPFLSTIQAVEAFRKPGQPASGTFSSELPFRVVPMSATPGSELPSFHLTDADRRNETLGQRLTANKLAILDDEVPTVKDDDNANQERLSKRLADKAIELSKETTLTRIGEYTPKVIGIVVNRVDTARRVFGLLKAPSRDLILLTGRIRPIDRDRLLNEFLGRMKSDPNRDRTPREEKTLLVVATQTIECGADLDLDALVTEVAPLDALRQRFGRLDRLGVLGRTNAVIVARRDRVAPNADDPIYGTALTETWKWLIAQAGDAKKGERVVDFGIDAMDQRVPKTRRDLDPLCSPGSKAPVLLPAHIDAWVQTEPLPVPDPDVSLFLHGPHRSSDVQIVWRTDLIDHNGDVSQADLPNKWKQIVSLVPPTTLEALPVPIHVAQAWLAQSGVATVADVEGQPEGDNSQALRAHRARSKPFKKALRWCGPDDSSLIGEPDDLKVLKPGDTIVVPTSYGGADRFGWDPEATEPVTDVGDLAAMLARGKPVLRIHADVVADWQPARPDSDRPTLDREISNLIKPPSTEVNDSGFTPDIKLILTTISTDPNLPPWVKLACDELIHDARRNKLYYQTGRIDKPLVLRGSRRLPLDTLRGLVNDLNLDKYDVEILSETDPDGPTGDDATSFRDLNTVTLGAHCKGVAELAAQFAAAIGLPDQFVTDLELAGFFHDLGKVDPRFQSWLVGGDEVAAEIASEPLAKSQGVSQDRASIARAR